MAASFPSRRDSELQIISNLTFIYNTMPEIYRYETSLLRRSFRVRLRHG